MGVEASIIVETKESVLYIPTSSIKSGNGAKYVLLVQGDGSTKQQEIKTGLVDTKNTEVVSGLSENDQVQISALPTSGFTSSTSNNRGTGAGIFSVIGGNRR
jgi:multidrug efflux pump subunit AcrA (membrane-fusion protein)